MSSRLIYTFSIKASSINFVKNILSPVGNKHRKNIITGVWMTC